MCLRRKKKGKSIVMSDGFCLRDSEASRAEGIIILAYLLLKCGHDKQSSTVLVEDVYVILLLL